MTIQHIRKFVTAVVGTAALAIALYADNVFTPEDWLAIGTSFLTAIGVYVIPNQPVDSKDWFDNERREAGQAYLPMLLVFAIGFILGALCYANEIIVG